MGTGDLLDIYPTELKFPFELRKQSSCSLQLTNKTDKYVAFKVKTTAPKKYCVRPNTGVVLPGSSCNVTVTMQAQKEIPPDMHSKDKFLIQGVLAHDGATSKDITQEMFNKVGRKIVDEFKLRVVFFPANPPSPVPEESEEEAASELENDSKEAGLSNDTWSFISELTDEKTSALQQNQQLRQELDLMRKEISKKHASGFSMVFAALVALFGVLFGYSMNWLLKSG